MKRRRPKKKPMAVIAHWTATVLLPALALWLSHHLEQWDVRWIGQHLSQKQEEIRQIDEVTNAVDKLDNTP